MKQLLTFIFCTISIISFSQYYTASQILNVRTNKLAYEGDMYLDTVSDDYYIGLTNGMPIRLGDNQKIDTLYVYNDSMLVLRIERGNEDTLNLNVLRNLDQWVDSAGFIYARQAKQSGNMVIITDGGRFSVGSSSPTKELDVNGEARIRNLPSGTITDSIVTTNLQGELKKRDVEVLAKEINFIKSFGKIASTGVILKGYNVASVTQVSTGIYRVFFSVAMSDVNYIIQLAQISRDGVGNDDPGISYYNQTTTTFDVRIGDNDNGGTDREKFNSEFMFTIIDR